MIPSFVSPSRLLAVWLLLMAVLDLAVVGLANLGVVSGLMIPTRAEAMWTGVESLAYAMAAIGLLWHMSMGWTVAVAVELYMVVSGVISISIAPPPINEGFLLAFGLLYHGMLLALLGSGPVRRDLFTHGRAPFSRLGDVAKVITAVGAGVLIHQLLVG